MTGVEFSGLKVTAAIVVRGSVPALDHFIREVRSRADFQVIYVRTGAGRLKIVPEAEADP